MESSNNNGHHNALLKLINFSYSKIVQDKAFNLISTYRDKIQYIEKKERGENEFKGDNATIGKECYYLVSSEGKEGTFYIVNPFELSNNDPKDICTCAAVYPCKHMYLVGLWIECLLHQNDKYYSHNKNPNNNDALEPNNGIEEEELLLFQPKIVLRENNKKYINDESKKRKNNPQLDNNELENDTYYKKEDRKDIENNDKNNNNNKRQRKNNIMFDILIQKGVLKPMNKLYYQEKGMDQPIDWFAYVNEEDGKVVDDKTRTVVYKTPGIFAKDAYKHDNSNKELEKMIQQKTHFYGNMLYKNIHVVEQNHQSLFHLMNMVKT